MNASVTTASSVSIPEEGGGRNDLKLEPSSDVTSSEAPTLPHKPLVTTLQITPVKASSDMTDAIRRQKKTGGIGYSKGNNSPTNAKPVFRAVISGNIKPGNMQYTITPSPVSNGNGSTNSNNISSRNTNNSSIYVSSNHSNNKQTNGTNTVAKNVTGTGNGGSYSVIYDKQGRMTTINIQSSSNGLKTVSQAEPNVSSGIKQVTRPPKLSLSHRSKGQSISDYPDGFNRSLTVDVLPSRTKENDTAAQDHLRSIESASTVSTALSLSNAEDSESQTLNRNKDSTYSSTSSKGTREDTALLSPGRSNSSKPLNRPTTKEPTVSSKLSNLPRAKSLDSVKLSGQKQGNTAQNLSYVSFADSILGAVGSDLNQMYQLCQSKVRYAEFIERSQPHRLGDGSDRESSRNGDPNHVRVTAMTSGMSHNSPSPYPLSPLTLASSPSSPLSSPRRAGLLPDLPVKPRQVIQSKQGFGTLATPTASFVSMSKVDAWREKKSFSSSLTTEPEIDYDRPVTIIIETDDNNAVVTRPILKSTKTKSGNGNGSEDLSSLSSNNTINDNNNNAVPAYLMMQNRTNGNFGSSSPRMNNSSFESGETTTYSSCTTKGRLVRFSTDYKVHEFVPFDPVTQPSEGL